MKNDSRNTMGIQLFRNKYRKIFRTPENFDYYTKEDFKTAERKFLRWVLAGGASNINRQIGDALSL